MSFIASSRLIARIRNSPVGVGALCMIADAGGATVEIDEKADDGGIWIQGPRDGAAHRALVCARGATRGPALARCRSPHYKDPITQSSRSAPGSIATRR